MNVSSFRRHLADAVESRRPFDTPEMSQLAAEADDVAYWRNQVRLDQAISLWKEDWVVRKPRHASGRFVVAVAAMALGLGVVWVSRPLQVMTPGAPQAATMTVAAVEVPGDVVSNIVVPEPIEPVVAPLPRGDTRLAEATVTAERLAYAFQPVGEQVGSVVRLLIDSVPGADVFAL